jgi:extracellular elastinolytic metalloproteinase
MPAARLRRVRWTTATIGVVAVLGASASGAAKVPSAAVPTVSRLSAAAGASFDVRQTLAVVPPGRTHAAATLRQSLGRFGRVDLDSRTGTPRIVQKLDGYLTAPSNAAPETVALSYVRAHHDLFGLDADDLSSLGLMRSWRTNEYTHLMFAQTVGGIPAMDNGVVANVAADGRLINAGGSPLPGLTVASLDPRVPAAEAVRTALSQLGVTGSVTEVATGSDPRRTTRFAEGHTARLTLFGAPGTSRLAWRVMLRRGSAPFADVMIDARTGTLLRQQSLIRDVVNALVFPNFPAAPVGGSQTTVDISNYITFPGDPQFFGDFAYSFTDVNDDGVREDIAPSSGDDYMFSFVPFTVPPGNCSPYPCSWDYRTPNSWTTNRRQAATQAFYFVNRFHDHLLAAPIQFTRAKGNFDGFDRVWISVDNGAALNGGLPDQDHLNNSFMSTGPPGVGEPVAYMQLELFQPVEGETFRSANSADDPSIVYHEYTHGLSNRLVSDVDWEPLLDLNQSNDLSEAWSDWYAMDYIVQQGFITDTPTGGEVKVGLYLGDSHRSQGLDCAVGAPAGVCPGGLNTGTGGYTYGDLGKVLDRPESHADGEIWAETLWDLRRRLIADRGAAEGVRRTQLLVTRAMELSPGQPSFLDMRNAILQADTVFNGGADRTAIWDVFAARGMGYFAGTFDASDVHPAENFAIPPPAGGPTGSIAGTLRNEQGAPLAGAAVSIGGHDSGFGDDLTATTNGSGQYVIGSVPVGTYEEVFAAAPGGYDLATAADVAVVGSQTTALDFTAIRDWAASAGGATIAAFTGPDYGPDCGPPRAIDTLDRQVWTTDSPADPSDPGPKSITVHLPTALNVSTFAIDPTAGCITGITASLGDFRIETSADGVSFAVSATGTFTSADTYRLNTVNPNPGTESNVRFVRLTGLTTQNMNPPFQGSVWMNVTELEVYGTTGGGGGACTRTGSAVSLALSAGGSYTIGRSGSNLAVTGPGVTDSSCGGATMTNIDSISTTGGSGSESLTIDLSGGPLGPGLTNEGTGTSEIEVSANLGPGADTLAVTGSAAADNYRFGTAGANLNGDDDGNDVVLSGIENLTVNGSAGNDVISAGGALGTASPLTIPVVLNGGSGNDKQTGGTGSDTINGGDGKDTCNALKAADGSDTCTGGAGVDTASYSARAGAVSLTNDGAANDGSAGESDNIASDVENLTGGKGGDTIKIATSGSNIGKGGGGNDALDIRDGIAANGDKADGGGGVADSCLVDAGDTKLNCEA